MDKAAKREALGVRTMTDELRAEIREYSAAMSEGLLTEEDFRDAVRVMVTVGWDGVDAVTRDYFTYRLQGHGIQEAALLAVIENSGHL